MPSRVECFRPVESPDEKSPHRDASRLTARENVRLVPVVSSRGVVPSAGGAVSAVHHRPTNRCVQPPNRSGATRLPTWRERLSHTTALRGSIELSPPQVASMRKLLAYRACANEYVRQIWLGDAQSACDDPQSRAEASQRPLNSAGPLTTCPGEQRPVPRPHHA